MTELKKKRSRFKQLIETYCGPKPYNFDLFVTNLEKDKYALSDILGLMGYVNDPAYFTTKEQLDFKNRLIGTRITITKITGSSWWNMPVVRIPARKTSCWPESAF